MKKLISRRCNGRSLVDYVNPLATLFYPKLHSSRWEWRTLINFDQFHLELRLMR